MKLRANQFGLLQEHRPAAPVLIGSLRSRCEGRRSMRGSGRSCFSLAAGVVSFLSGAQPASGTLFRPALARTPFRLASARVQRLAASAVLRLAQAASRHSRRVSGRFMVAAQVRILSSAQPLVATPFRLAFVRTATRPASARAQRLSAPIVMRFAQALSWHPRPFSAGLASRFVLQTHAEKPAPSSSRCSNPALNPVRFALWTLRDKAAQRRLALRYAFPLPRRFS